MIAPRTIATMPAITAIAARIHKSVAAPALRCAPMTSMVLILLISRPGCVPGHPTSQTARVSDGAPRRPRIRPGPDRVPIRLEVRARDHRDDDTDEEHRRHRCSDRSHARGGGHDGVRGLHALGA